jgi:hypothetical protein
LKVRLEAAGYFNDEGKDITDSVFERPVMLVYTGSFESMDGPVTISDDHIRLLHDTHNSTFSKIKRMATGDVPMRDCPPLQLDHSSSAQHTIGRLVGPLSMGNIEIGGETRLALFGTSRFLGKENVEKAKDGRWTHVSIGADLESGKLNELSVTPFPAAGNASLLSKFSSGEHKGIAYEVQRTPDGNHAIVVEGKIVKTHPGTEEEVRREAEKYIDEQAARMTAGGGETMETKEQIKARHLTEKEHLAGQHTEELKTHKLEEVKGKHDEALRKLSEKHAEEMKRLGFDKEPPQHDEESEREAEKLAAKTKFITLAKGLKTGSTKLRSDLRIATVGAKLSKLRSLGKLTPAEIKKIDLSKFGSMSDAEVDASLASYDALEPRVMFGTMTGTTKAEAVSKVQQKYRLARMELESRMNMPSKRKEAEKAMSRLMDEERRELAEVGQPNEADPTKGMLSKHPSYEEMSKMLDEGKHEELRGHLKRMHDYMAHAGEHLTAEGDDQRMSALAKTQSALQNQFDELVALASPALGVNSDEI